MLTIKGSSTDCAILMRRGGDIKPEGPPCK